MMSDGGSELRVRGRDAGAGAALLAVDRHLNVVERQVVPEHAQGSVGATWGLGQRVVRTGLVRLIFFLTQFWEAAAAKR